MSSSVDQRIVAAIAETIRDRVLPEVPSGWASGYLNSALQLLALLEDRLELADGIVAADNIDLKALLQNAVRVLGQGASPPSVVAAVNAVDRDDHATNSQLRAALDDLIVAVWGPAKDTPEHDAVRSAITSYRVAAMSREAPMWARAAAMPPV